MRYSDNFNDAEKNNTFDNILDDNNKFIQNVSDKRNKNERNKDINCQNNWENEIEFVRALTKGDENAYRQLYRLFASKIGALAKSYLGTDDVDDIVQEVFVRIFKSVKKFRGESKLSTWVYRITVNVCNNVYKKFKNKVISLDVSNEEDEEYVYKYATEEDIKRDYADTILYEKLRKIVESFSPEDRAILFMKEIDGLTYDEIGKILEKPEGTIKSRLHYIKERIRKELGEVRSDVE
ncbi:MAG: RNA polymerase sigma factor [Fervidobacterium sp.]